MSLELNATQNMIGIFTFSNSKKMLLELSATKKVIGIELVQK